MTAFLIGRFRPDEGVHVYDHDWRPAPRVALYAGYKGNRAPDPPDLPPQFDLLRQVLDALGQPQAEAPGWEADDAIAALAARADARLRRPHRRRDRRPRPDPDWCATRRFACCSRSEASRRSRSTTKPAVMAKYGLPAARYGDFAILRGDPSDGLPGVPGVGEKTAAALVAGYDSLDELLEAADGRSLSKGPAGRSPRLVGEPPSGCGLHPDDAAGRADAHRRGGHGMASRSRIRSAPTSSRSATASRARSNASGR